MRRLFPLCFVLVLFPALLFSCKNISSFHKETPGYEDIDKKIEEYREQELKKAERNAFFQYVIIRIIQSVRDKRTLVRFGIILGGILLLFGSIGIIIYFIITRRSLDKRAKDIAAEYSGESTFSIDRQKIEECLRNKNYTEAVLWMYHFSILYLLETFSMREKNLTNAQFYLKIKNNNQREAFRIIYSVAEQILFDDYTASEDDYAKCRNQYSTHFIGTT